jgi:hypothetical protein
VLQVVALGLSLAQTLLCVTLQKQRLRLASEWTGWWGMQHAAWVGLVCNATRRRRATAKHYSLPGPQWELSMCGSPQGYGPAQASA